MARGHALDRISEGSDIFTAGGSARTLNHLDAGKIIQLDTAAGTTITLPAALGTGDIFYFCTTVIATSNSHIVKVGNTTDVMSGSLNVVDNADGTVTAFGTVAASDTITLNRTTTGSVKIGEFFWARDIKAGYWAIGGTVIATGSEVSPFSEAVSP